MLANVLFPINSSAFTYQVPDELQPAIKAGARVNVPFKKSHKVGIVVKVDSNLHSHPLRPPADRRGTKKQIILKSIKSLLDDEPLLPKNLLRLIEWVGQYYMSTSGLALKNAVPAAFFTEKKAGKSRITYDEEVKKEKALNLTSEQSRSLNNINKSNKGVFLLHGVTGSGKTEVYIKAIKALPEGREAIVLVPEIAITAQMADRFRSSFGERVVFFHSGLSVGERITQWQKMRNGEVGVVIGVRSAVFAPFTNLGMIVIDEEQEASYKQFEGLRYNARDVALARAKLEGIKILLGSATPSLEVYYNAMKGKFKYLELKHRVEHKPMPLVEIIDMTRAEKQTFSFSINLLDALKENVTLGHQSLIMLNRRGYSPFFMCTDCGHTHKCPACSITLIYHKDTNSLNCHYCGSYLDPVDTCPVCNGTGVKYLGTGTQRVEEDLCLLLPGLSFKRMDRDSTAKKLSHYRIVRQMEEKKLDVLLGTQMVAKGHDFPDVTLSAVVSADISLNLPDFRSGERAFQLFTQLAGRAGRGEVSGRAMIQTYEPDHYVFEYVLKHDYKGFYRREIELRKELNYPPFSRLVRIILSFKTKEAAKKTAKVIMNRIRKTSYKGIEVLGPAPAPIERIRRLWRWHLVLKGKNAKSLRLSVSDILSRLNDVKDMKIDVDVDPVNMM
jgi:primosomal protein N' (replication factor Y)